MFEGGTVLDQSSYKKCVLQITHHDTNSKIIKNKCPTIQPICVTFHLKDWLLSTCRHDYKHMILPVNHPTLSARIGENPVQGSKRLLPSGLSIAWIAFQSYDWICRNVAIDCVGVNQTKREENLKLQWKLGKKTTEWKTDLCNFNTKNMCQLRTIVLTYGYVPK